MSNDKYVYFTEEEVKGLDTRLVVKLDQARHIANVPFVITSGLRTRKNNTDAGGAEDSSHLAGLAVDLACQDSTIRFFILTGLFRAGFNRIGVYDRHVHCDVALDLPQNVVWTGVSH